MATIVIRRVEESAEKLGIAHLLYERDGPFVPVTPLAVLRSSTTFFKASLAGQPLRAASSYEEWLEGCDEPGDPLTSVYELASSIVREPLGGFASPSLQQLFSAVRLLDILYSRIPEQGERPDSFVSVVAAIAAQNARSLAGMRGLGMVPVDPLPRWLEYEHRSWFPKLARDHLDAVSWLHCESLLVRLDRFRPSTARASPSGKTMEPAIRPSSGSQAGKRVEFFNAGRVAAQGAVQRQALLLRGYGIRPPSVRHHERLPHICEAFPSLVRGLQCSGYERLMEPAVQPEGGA